MQLEGKANQGTQKNPLTLNSCQGCQGLCQLPHCSARGTSSAVRQQHSFGNTKTTKLVDSGLSDHQPDVVHACENSTPD